MVDFDTLFHLHLESRAVRKIRLRYTRISQILLFKISGDLLSSIFSQGVLVDLTVKNEKNETGASGPRGGCARDFINIPKYTFSGVGYRGARRRLTVYPTPAFDSLPAPAAPIATAREIPGSPRFCATLGYQPVPGD